MSNIGWTCPDGLETLEAHPPQLVIIILILTYDAPIAPVAYDAHDAVVCL